MEEDEKNVHVPAKFNAYFQKSKENGCSLLFWELKTEHAILHAETIVYHILHYSKAFISILLKALIPLLSLHGKIILLMDS